VLDTLPVRGYDTARMTNPSRTYARVAIVGPGLVGGAMGIALRARKLAREVVGIGRRESSLEEAVRVGAIDRGTLDLAGGVAGAEVVTFATPADLVAPLAEEAAPHLAEGALVTDLASAKARLVPLVERAVAARARFVGSHPLAGSEKKGASHAPGVRLEGALCLVTPTEATEASAVEEVEALWHAIGMRVARLSPAEHDARLARTSHVPHMAAAGLSALLESGDGAYAAAGFRDATRIAAGDARVWSAISMENADEIVKNLRGLSIDLMGLAHLIEEGEADQIRLYLEKAAERRAREIGGG